MSEPNRRKPTIGILKSREDVTNGQVELLLAMIDRVSQDLVLLTGKDETTGDARHIDGGVKVALDVLAIKACDRLESILDDPSRWGTKDYDRAFKQILATQKANQRSLEQQAAAAAFVRLPSFIHRPTLVSTGGKWYAYIGDPAIPGMALFGSGETPELALADFNDAFLRADKDQIKMIIKPDDAPEQT